METETIDWTGVRQRLADIAASPNAANVFGYRGHHFVLEPVLSPEDLAELETQIRVRLPDDYRSFLLTVGRGGAGPYYGLFSVEKVDGLWRWTDDGGSMTDLDHLDRPFPLQGLDEAVLAALQAEQPDEETYEPQEDFDAAHEEWYDQMLSLFWDDARTYGAICISHQGCARREWLVVSGPERGNVWTDNRVDEEDLAPLRQGDFDRTTFAAWYLTWLASAEIQAGLS